MAKRKRSTRNNIVGVVIAAALIGSVIGAVIFYDPGEPLPSPGDVKFTEKYDDDWGKLKAPISHVDVEQILISWKGANARVTPKDPERTKEEAWELVEQIWNRYKVNPTKENFADLQTQYNEDSTVHNTYSMPDPRTGDPNGGLVKAFADCSKTTEEGFARIVESEFGYHLIRRKKQDG
ncbi:MAG: peptidylprolyl isomerase [Planctomycetes bacterium]|nr:peptidylprolyl isomerase [Planctomycetota bacterium]